MYLVSVVIPCRNEIDHIINLVDSIEDSDYNNELIEVLIIDGLSNDGTRELLYEKYNHGPLKVRIIDNVNQRTPFAFNIGIKEAIGEFILIVGARHKISTNYISEAINALRNDMKIGCVGGIVNNSFENKTSELISFAMSTKFGMGFSNFRTQSVDTFVDSVGTPCFRRSIFNEIGYFDENLTRNQDDDFSYRLIQAGYKILLKGSINVNYYVRSNYHGLFHQFMQYGYWKVYVNKKHRRLTTNRQVIPFLFVISIFVFFLFAFFDFRFLYILYLELGVYFFFSFLSAVRLFYKGEMNILNIFKLIFTYLVLHIGYGLGYLNGIVDFIFYDKLPSKKYERLTR